MTDSQSPFGGREPKRGKSASFIARAKRNARVCLGRLWRRTFTTTTFICVTGSCGKTTATDLLGKLLSSAPSTILSRGSGAPASIARALLALRPWRDRHVVFEVSGHAPGAIVPVADLVRPDVAVVTTVGADHRQRFGTLAATAQEKGNLVAAVPSGGLVVLNADDPNVRAMRERSKARVVTYGRAVDADLRLVESSMKWPAALHLTVSWRGESFSIESTLIGVHWSTSLLAALTAALELGVDIEKCRQAIARFRSPFNRMSAYRTPDGREFVIDAWKAPHWGLKACLGFLGDAQAPRKTVVFGTISDYHGAPKKRYEEAALWALDVADRVLFVGPESSRVRRFMKTDLRHRIHPLPTVEAAHAFLTADRIENELIYVKSSRADHLERLLHAQFAELSCWRDRCGRKSGCIQCTRLLNRRIRTRREFSLLPWLSPGDARPI